MISLTKVSSNQDRFFLVDRNPGIPEILWMGTICTYLTSCEICNLFFVNQYAHDVLSKGFRLTVIKNEDKVKYLEIDLLSRLFSHFDQISGKKCIAPVSSKFFNEDLLPRINRLKRDMLAISSWTEALNSNDPMISSCALEKIRRGIFLIERHISDNKTISQNRGFLAWREQAIINQWDTAGWKNDDFKEYFGRPNRVNNHCSYDVKRAMALSDRQGWMLQNQRSLSYSKESLQLFDLSLNKKSFAEIVLQGNDQIFQIWDESNPIYHTMHLASLCRSYEETRMLNELSRNERADQKFLYKSSILSRFTEISNIRDLFQYKNNNGEVFSFYSSVEKADAVRRSINYFHNMSMDVFKMTIYEFLDRFYCKKKTCLDFLSFSSERLCKMYFLGKCS